MVQIHKHFMNAKFSRASHILYLYYSNDEMLTLNYPILFSRYQPSQLFAVVSDVRHYPKFVPFCTGSRILSERYRDASQPPPSTPTADATYSMDVELSVGFLAFQETYTSKVTCRPNELVEVSQSSGSSLCLCIPQALFPGV